jgi:hypothetical protein
MTDVFIADPTPQTNDSEMTDVPEAHVPSGMHLQC